MRSFNVSLRIRRLPRKMMRSTTAGGGWSGRGWSGRAWRAWSGTAFAEGVTFGDSDESKEALGCECADPSDVRFSDAATGKPEARNNTTPAIQKIRTRRSPNGEQTLI